MEAILLFVQDILSTPAIFVGIIAMIGLLLQKSNVPTIIKGTIKTILGFMVLSAGSTVITEALTPFGDLFGLAFGLHGVVPNNEAFIAYGLADFAVETASIFALGMLANIVLARFSSMKCIFLSGHISLYFACMFAIILSVAGLSGWQLILAGSLLLGFVMAFLPTVMRPYMEKLTGDDSLGIAHSATVCYWLSAKIGEIIGKRAAKKGEEVTSAEDINFPQSISFLRDSSISIALVMVACYLIVTGIGVVAYPAEAAAILNDQNWIVFAATQGIMFSAGVYVVLAGVRLVIAEIVPAFKGISEKLVPSAVPAIDCPAVFPFAPNAVLIGFISSFVGGVIAMLALVAMGQAGLAVSVVLPGVMVHFFCGATSGVFGNIEGGVKGAVAGGFIHGLLQTFLVAGLLPVMGSFGFANTSFSDADEALAGIVLGNASGVLGGNILLVLIVVLFCAPIVYTLATGRGKAQEA